MKNSTDNWSALRAVLHTSGNLQQHEFILLLTAVTICSIAAVTDIRTRRIPNWLTYPTMLLGIGYHGLISGVQGLFFGTEGLLLGLAFLSLFYLAGGTAAGDVKLMGGVGALLGPHGVFTAYIFTALIGGLYSLLLLIVWFRIRGTFTRLATLFTSLCYGTGLSGLAEEKSRKVPILNYGVAIALGVSVAVAWDLYNK